METIERATRTQEETPAWEQVPETGPGVLIADRWMLDEGGGICGGWLRLDQERAQIAADLAGLLGGREARDFVVIDQVGMGEVMWDEDDVAGLLELARGVQS